MNHELFQFHGAVVLASIIALFVLFNTAWQKFVVDVVRQRAFEARDAALLWAHDTGKIQSPEYKDFREFMNVSIRYFDEMSLIKIIGMLAVRRPRGLHMKHMEGSSFLNDSHLRREFNNVTTAMTAGLILRSPVGMVLLMLLTPFFVLVFILNSSTSKRTEKFASRIRSEVQTDILMAH